MNGEMEGEIEVFRTSLNQMYFAAHRVGMGSEAVVSRVIEVTILPLFREVEIGPMVSGPRLDVTSI